MSLRQTTLRSALRFRGTGLHTGKACVLTLHPATADTGLQFLHKGHAIPGVFENVITTTPATILASPSSASSTLSTVDQILAALSAAAVDNVHAEVSAPELPIMDGSAAPFARALAGNVCALDGSVRKRVWVTRSVAVGERGRYVRLEPREKDSGLVLDVTSQYLGLGTQRLRLELGEELFRGRIARARRFWFRREVEVLRNAGFVKGGVVDCGLVLDDDGRVLSDGGLRFADEVCRHQILQCIGQLRLGGCFVAEFVAVRPAHALIVELLRKLYRDPNNYCIG